MKEALAADNQPPNFDVQNEYFDTTHHVNIVHDISIYGRNNPPQRHPLHLVYQ